MAAAKVVLLHAQKAHARRGASVVRIRCKQRRKALLRIVEPVRVERRKRGALCRRARDAGVHLRQLRFFCPSDCPAISVSCGCCLRYSRNSAAEAGLAESQISAWRRAACAFRVLGMLLQNADALGACLRGRRSAWCPARRQTRMRRGCARPVRACPPLQRLLPLLVP